MTVAVVLPRGDRAARAGRLVVEQHCQGAGIDRVSADLAVLLSSELVTNAVTHGSGPVRLAVASHPCGRLLVTVSDAGEGLVAASASTDCDRLGLRLVELLSAGWGVRKAAVGKTVWFELQTGLA